MLFAGACILLWVVVGLTLPVYLVLHALVLLVVHARYDLPIPWADFAWLVACGAIAGPFTWVWWFETGWIDMEVD